MGTQLSKKNSPQLSQLKYDLSRFAVITVLFNPIKYKSRYDLYHKFNKHMLRCGIKLFTIECIFDIDEQFGLPRQRFEITRANEPRHLQIKAPSVIWLKENLINIAVKHLPSSIEYIAWLDADIEFQSYDWPYLAIDQLRHYPIVQLFQLSFFLGPSGKKQILRRDYSFVYSITHGEPIDFRRSSECYFHPGYAWAMRRKTFDDIGGLLDFSILGSGDIHFAYALLNRIDETIPSEIHNDYRRLANVWGERVAQVAGNGTHVSYIPVNIWHHWHGSRRDRRYTERWALLERFQFSPLTDLEKNDRTGLIRLTDNYHYDQSNSAQRLKLLETNIINYFRLRDEDNMKNPIPTLNTDILSNEPTMPSNQFFRPIVEASIHSDASSIEDYYKSNDSTPRHYLSEYQSHSYNNDEVVL
ncbi:unnamed protein product [Rotaria sordida]|uniref:Uncharacterized protein n=1 Tax=Rotaria sordida TaxID=392033 RepID=A0A815G667_9BILA|nr:unnamed protein product [Rotaria sordida]